MLAKILASYPMEHQLPRIEDLGNAGGFSGAKLWRLKSQQGQLCLRRWPAHHPSAEQLRWIHAIQQHALSRCPFVPKLFKTCAGETSLYADGHLWELSRWMPGRANFQESPSDRKLRAAMAALAQFHQVAAEVQTTVGLSRGLAERYEFCTALMGDQLDHLRASLQRALVGSLSDPAIEICHEVLLLASPRIPEIAAKLRLAKAASFRLQPCLRDIWHDHILFEENQVAGLIDFGAMRIETVSGDIVRLLGSLVVDRDLKWQVGLAAYEKVRPLDQSERSVLAIFDQSNVVLSGFNWIRWLFVEGRQFSDIEAVVARLQKIRQQLQALN